MDTIRAKAPVLYTGDLTKVKLTQNYEDRRRGDKVQDEKSGMRTRTNHTHKKKDALAVLVSSPLLSLKTTEGGCRNSTILSAPSVDDMPNDPQEDESVHLDNNEDDNEERDQDAVSLEPFGMSEHSKCSPAEVKTTMQGFASAMEVSQKSQQAIHDWDKKMGLKRSHSKTMRLSARSRKKLRASFKKEINALSSKS
jgi:hypothetical protein